jgi:hypothetical protein
VQRLTCSVAKEGWLKLCSLVIANGLIQNLEPFRESRSDESVC